MSRLIVKNLPKKITEQRIRELFSQKGRITDVQLKYTKEGVFRQFCFLGYETEEHAQAALEYFNKSYVDTTKICVELCAPLGEVKSKKVNKKEIPEEKPEDPKGNKEKKKKITNKDREEDIIKEHKDDPEFQEFLKVHAVGGKTVWDNDTSVPEAAKAGKKTSEEALEEHADEENEHEAEEEDGQTSKTADKAISDLDYMKSLMPKSSKNLSAEKKKPQKEKDTEFFTLKMFNLPYNTKRSDIMRFFKPLKPKSVRIPINSRGYCYVGFQDKKELTKALSKHKSFIKEKQVTVVDITETSRRTLKQKLGLLNDGQGPDKNGINAKWQKQNESLVSEEAISESGKIYFRNLTYSVTEEDLQKLFEKYGPVAEINLPIDSHSRQIKGFGTVTFMLPEHAIVAFNELDGHSFHGRMLHLLPAKADQDKSEDDAEDTNTGSYKKKKEKELKKSAGQSHNWNTLFLGANAVAEIMAKTYGTSKEHILDSETGGSSAAVRLALGETQIVSELRKFLEDNGVRLEAFDEVVAKKLRSKTVILAKNLPAHTDVKELQEIFSKFGVVGRIVLPPSGVTALIEFLEPSEAKKAFTKLAYTKFKDAPLYLEWAPENIFHKPGEKSKKITDNEEQTPEDPKKSSKKKKQEIFKEEIPEEKTEEHQDEEEPDEDDTIPPEPDTTIFLRNLNFATREDTLQKHFTKLGPIHLIQVAMKKDPENPGSKISLGYGFVQFKRKHSAERALKTMQFTEIDGNKVELKKSDRILKSQVKSTTSEIPKKAQKQTGSKILVRNIPFQAKESEVREIFRAFGELKSVRLPLKVTPGEKSHRGFGFVDFFSKNDAKNAFKNLSQSTHLYGRRLVLEWAAPDEDVQQLRKRTADHFVESRGAKKSKKSVFSGKEIEGKSNKIGDSSDEELSDALME